MLDAVGRPVLRQRPRKRSNSLNVLGPEVIRGRTRSADWKEEEEELNVGQKERICALVRKT